MPSNEEWPDWAKWLAWLVHLAPSQDHALAVLRNPEAWRSYWEQGYSPDHAWQEAARDESDAAPGRSVPGRQVFAPA